MWVDKIQRIYDDIITIQMPLPRIHNAQMSRRERSAAQYRLDAIMPKVASHWTLLQQQMIAYRIISPKARMRMKAPEVGQGQPSGTLPYHPIGTCEAQSFKVPDVSASVLVTQSAKHLQGLQMYVLGQRINSPKVHLLVHSGSCQPQAT